MNVFYSYSGCNVWPNDDHGADDEVHNIITIHSYSLLTKSELHKLQYPQRQHQGNDKNSTSAEVRWMVGGRWWSEDRNSWHVNAGSSCNTKQAIAHYSLSNKSRFKSITVVDTVHYSNRIPSIFGPSKTTTRRLPCLLIRKSFGLTRLRDGFSFISIQVYTVHPFLKH